MEAGEFVCAGCNEFLIEEATTGICHLCSDVHCDDCINERGICMPCGEKLEYSMLEAVSV